MHTNIHMCARAMLDFPCHSGPFGLVGLACPGKPGISGSQMSHPSTPDHPQTPHQQAKGSLEVDWGTGMARLGPLGS